MASAISCLAEISAASVLEEDSTLIAVSSSRIFPWGGGGGGGQVNIVQGVSVSYLCLALAGSVQD